MTAVVEADPVVTAVITVLETTGFKVGDGKAPEGASGVYSVVYPLADFERDGPWSDPQADVVHQIQVTAVGDTRAQAQRLADKNRAAMQTETLVIPGRNVFIITLADGVGGSVERDRDRTPPPFYAVDIWRIPTSPA